MVGERPVKLEVERHQGEGQPLEDLRHGVAGHPVPRVHGYLQRPDGGEVHELLEVGRVPGQQVPLDDDAGGAVVGREALGRGVAQLRQPGLRADRPGPFAAQLDPVVLGRVVAGRDHRPGHAQAAAGVVQHVGRAEAALDHVGTLGDRAPGERPGQRLGRGAHVMHGDDAGGAGQPDERRPYRLGDLLIELVGNDPADVIRLEDLLVGAH